jgi:hypothetical protein
MKLPITHIHVPLPINTTSYLSELLSVRQQYTVPTPSVKKIRNAFVSHEGLVLKNGLLVVGCAFNLYGKEDNTFYYQFWRDTVEKFAVCKWGKSLQSIQLKGDKSYLLIHSNWLTK